MHLLTEIINKIAIVRGQNKGNVKWKSQIHFFQTTELCIGILMKIFAITINVSIALRSMNVI